METIQLIAKRAFRRQPSSRSSYAPRHTSSGTCCKQKKRVCTVRLMPPPHRKRGLRHSRTNCLMLAATLAMYALSALDWAIDIRLLWNDLRTLRFYGLPDAPASGPFGLSSPPLLVLQGITSVICVGATFKSSAFDRCTDPARGRDRSFSEMRSCVGECASFGRTTGGWLRGPSSGLSGRSVRGCCSRRAPP